MSKDLTMTMTGDGFDVSEPGGGGLMIGRMMKFNNGTYYVDKTEVMPLGTALVVVGVVTVWIKWRDGRPIERRVTYPGQTHPDRNDLPDQDQSVWELGLSGQPADPWKDSRYLHLVDPRTGADYTFVTDSYGGRRAIGDLKSQISNVRFAHPSAVPVVQLASTMMPTDYGPKPRPQFKVVSWKGAGGGEAAVIEQKQITAPAAPTKKTIDDEIPF
jgi:hypothetical protein